MVNYCCVNGCGRNNRTSKHLNYYSFPKERHREIEWLHAIGREDLLEKNVRLFHRVCSRHFSPSSIKNKHLCADAVPTLCLPGHPLDGSDEESEESKEHENIICNSCNEQIIGFRYKCITCPDYDLCSKCEKFEVHPEHCMLRIPRPMKFKIADDLTTKWKRFLKSEDNGCADNLSSDDDVPITKYIKQNDSNDSGIDLPEDVKAKIRDEVTRVLNIKHNKPDKKVKKSLKRKIEIKNKRNNEELVVEKKLHEVTLSGNELVCEKPEVAFADVNDIKSNQMLNIKHEVPNLLTVLVDSGQPMMQVKLSDDFSDLITEVKFA